MAIKPKSHTVLEPLAETTVDSNNSPVKSIALSRSLDDHVLIYVGTSSGMLLLYSLRISQNAPPKIVFVRRIFLPASSVISIQPLVHMPKIIVLSGGLLHLVDSGLVEPSKKLSLFKGITAFSRKIGSDDRADNVYNNGNNVSGRNFFAVGIGKKLVLAELILSGSLVVVKEIHGVFDGTILTVLWVDDSVFLGTKTGYYLYNFLSGKCDLIFSLPDGSGLPRLKLLVKDSRVLLMVDNVGIVVDMDGQPVGGSLVFKDAPESISEIGSFAVAAKTSLVELYHKKMGCCVQRIKLNEVGGVGSCVLADEENESGKLVVVAMDLKLICYGKVAGEEQIKDLLRKRSYREAISLVEELEKEGEVTEEMVSFINAQVGFLLLFDLHFKEAVDHFLLSKTMQPSEIFPFIMRDPNRWTLLVPRNRYWGLHPPPTLLENVIDNGLTAIQRTVFLKKAGVETAVDDDFLLKPPSRADLLESAIENMIRYLQACRERDLDLLVKEGVDTLLMYLYRALNRVEDMEKLASSDNSCIVDELEALLNESGHFRILAFLYAGKGMNGKALSIWRMLARNYSSNSLKDKQMESDFKDPSKRLAFARETAASEASKILEESSDQDLILQHLGWIADISPVLAVQSLISEKRENQLSPDDVIAAIDPKKVEILQRYLQWLIEDHDSDDPQFHTAYALLLAKSALESYDADLGMLQKMESSEILKNSIFETHVRERLQIFLQSSELYDAEEVLYVIEESELWLEKAILYRRLGQETLVLQILALKLENCDAAEEYCAEIGRPDAYMQLLQMYLDPEDGRQPMFKAASRLLHNHGEMLDPLQVLERLSPEMPLELASDTILRILRARHHHLRQGQIVHSLSRALNVNESLARLEERSRHVLINEESICDSCRARLGTKLFAMYPDDTVICYKCFRRQGESTSVTGRDFKKDILVKPGWLVTR